MRIITKGYGEQSNSQTLIVLLGFGGTAIAAVSGVSVTSVSWGQNVKRSLEQYINSNLYSTDGISVKFEGLPFEDTQHVEWIQPLITGVSSDFQRQGGSNIYAENATVGVSVNIFVKKSGVTISDRHYVLADTVANYFKIGQDIPLREYAGSGTTTLTQMRVRNVIADGPMGETNELLKYRLGWELDFVRLTDDPS